MRPSESASPDNGGGLSSPQAPPLMNTMLLREDQAERERLKMDNFNQALRINFLEERLLRHMNGTAFEGEELESEVFQLRITLQERDNELKQKSFSMMRATELLHALQHQLADAKNELARARSQSHSSHHRDEAVEQQLRVDLKRAQEREQTLTERLRELEDELGNHQDTVATITAKHHELLQAHSDQQREIEDHKHALQKAEIVQSSAGAEVEQWRLLVKQRDDEIARLKEQLEQRMREKEHSDARYQSKLKRMEEQVQNQMEQLKRESENYRVEHTRIVTEREKAHFERERMGMEADAIKTDKLRLQKEMERLANELERITGDAELLRLQNVKLTATCEHKTQTLESYKSERENTMESFHKLETELHQWRSACNERDLTIKSLEMRAHHAEEDAQRVRVQMETLSARNQQTSNERLVSLEKDRHAIEQDNFRLRKELATFQHELESLEARFQSCDTLLKEEKATAKEYQTRYLHCEQELQQRAAQLEDAEQRLADVTVATSSSETAIMKQQTECANQFAAEKRELLQALHEEQQHADALERTMTELETTNANLMQLLDGIEREFSGVTGQQSRSTNPDRFHSLLPQVQGAIKSIQREFNTEAAKLQSQWQQQAETMTSQLDELSKQLHTSQGKLEVLQRTTVHVKDDKQATERTWMMKYEQLRVEKESERRTLERELRDTQSKVASAEAAAAQVKTELGVLTRRRDGTRAELERDYHDLKESNRLLYEEVQERRRAAEHARKQYLAAVKENKDLLAAVDVYKSAISEREKDIEYYKATLMKNTQQLQRRVSMGEVKQTLLEQLEQTQYMINETYKRWSDSDIGHGAIFTSNNNGMEQDSAVVVHLDEYIGRMEIVTERWNEFINQSRDLQRRYSSAWRSAVADFNARGDERQERPEWTDDVERRSTRLLTESVRVSEALRDVVENILSVIQRERNERKAFDKTRALESHDLKKMRANSLKEWQSSLSPKKSYADQRYDDKSRRESQSSPSNQLSHNETKKRNGSASRRSSSARGSERLGTNTIYHNSLSSLGRIGSELQEIEKKIQSYQE